MERIARKEMDLFPGVWYHSGAFNPASARFADDPPEI
jgi:hypothetical protein